MRLYTMARTEEDGVDFDGEPFIREIHEYFVKLETENEQQVYNESIGCTPERKYNQGLWDGYMSAKLDWDTCDENTYAYISIDRPDVPLHGKYVDADGIEWERIK